MKKLNNNLYLLYGNEKYLIDKFNEEIVNTSIDKNFIDFNLDSVDFTKKLDFDSVISKIETLPLFDKNRIYILDNLDLSKGGISTNKEFIDQLSDYIDLLPKHCILIINSYTEKVFKGKLYKKIEKSGNITVSNKLNYKDLTNWILEFTKLNNINLSDNLIDYVINKSAYLNKDLDKNLYDLDNELIKLKKYNTKITKANIDSIFVSSFETNIFKLTDAISRKQVNTTLKIYNDILISTDDSFRIFYMVVRLIRNILITKESLRMKMTEIEISNKFSISNYEIKKIKSIIKLWKYNEIKKAIHKSYDTEVLLKSSAISSNKIVENYLISILN